MTFGMIAEAHINGKNIVLLKNSDQSWMNPEEVVSGAGNKVRRWINLLVPDSLFVEEAVTKRLKDPWRLDELYVSFPS